MSSFKKSLFLGLLLAVLNIAQAAGPIISMGTVLRPISDVYSANGRYNLAMQSDGNLVLYRNDGLVRFATYKYGSANWVVMQGDGNFVEYNASNQPLWATYTQGKGSYVAVQDDGNLVVYSSSGSAVWSIGADLDASNSPSQVGDVAGRDMDFAGLGSIGHLGVWTGSNIVEANTYGTNAVRYVQWDDFKNATKLWGISRPNIPDHLIYYCFSTYCEWFTGSNYPPAVSARTAIAKRAQQAYLIGADFTISTQYTPAHAALPGQPATRGIYRCDTFVIDLFSYTAGWNLNKPVPQYWADRINNLIYNTTRTPNSIWSALKN